MKTSKTFDRAEKALIDEVERQVQAQGGYSGPANDRPDYVDAYLDYPALTRAVLMAVRELPEGFISQRRKLFESTEYLEYDFTTVLDEILNDEEQ